jgi:hypothetical protein
MLGGMRVKLATTANAARWFILLPFTLIVADSGPKMFAAPTTGWRILHASLVLAMTINVVWHWVGGPRFRRSTE